MIKGFVHKGLENFFYDGIKKGLQAKHLGKIELILDLLDAAADIKDMKFSGSNLHLLQPKKDRIWSVKVSGNWRITFRFEAGDVYIVDYRDYH